MAVRLTRDFDQLLKLGTDAAASFSSLINFESARPRVFTGEQIVTLRVGAQALNAVAGCLAILVEELRRGDG